MPDYGNGKIYMIYPTCEYEEGDVYYGSTIQPLSKRMAKHRCQNMIKPLADKYGLENLKIELVCEFKCETKEQLNKEEGKYIRENKCINKEVAGRTHKEYREANKDKISERNKKYKEANKDKILEKKKQYYEANKDKMKEYVEANKDKIKEYKKQYYENKKRLRQIEQ